VLDVGWRAVRLGRKLRDDLKKFSYGELREPLLTNKRFLLLKDDKIDYEIPVSDIKGADYKMTGGYWSDPFPYFIIELKNDETDLFAFVRVLPKRHPSEYTEKFFERSGWRLSPITIRIMLKWEKTINELIGTKQRHKLKYKSYKWFP
jgi:hypothetical protein